ncbi:MAG: AAA family ATPase, partial [Blastocatellia bacterium]|nr:AAA family ATPase [Blastocatellia bacterium]
MSYSSGEFLGNERFKIRRRLGAGGMGVVYEAYDANLNETVALKTLLRVDASAIYRFKKEFRSLAGVVHPNLVSLYELIAEGEYWFFTMEMIEGVTFLEYVGERNHKDSPTSPPRPPTHPTPRIEERLGLEGNTVSINDTGALPSNTQTLDIEDVEAESKLPIASARAEKEIFTSAPFSVNLDRLREALKQLVEGVYAIHEMGMLHRDIKPSNVLVTPEDRVVILDFGLVTEAAPEESSQSLSVVGTPIYMSPEHGAGLPLTEASDWYSVGTMLYEALTGRTPFLGQNIEVLVNKQKFDPPAPSEIAPGTPSDLDALCRDLLRRDPEERPSGRDLLERLGANVTETAAPTPALLPPLSSRPAANAAAFVGRKSHIEALDEAFVATRQGRTVTVYVHGASGMGKSTLVRHFLERLHQREGAVVLEGRCYEQESVPYKALDGLIDSLSKYLLSLPQIRADALMPRDVLALSRLFPVMLRVEAVTSAPFREQAILEPLELRRRAWAALRELLARLADRHPLALSIDDLQWADADSIALLDDLLRPPDPPRLLLLASFRSEEIESKPFLKALLRQTGSETYRELQVGPLKKKEARSLAESLLPAEMPGIHQFSDTIVREAEGNPFFVEELARYALTAEKAATTGITLAEMLESRMARLPDGARTLLEILAVAGRPMDSEVIFEAAGLNGDGRSLIASLRATHFLRSSGSLQRVELYHDRIRETLAAMLDRTDARRIHLRLARTLELKGFDDPEALFEHYLGAGDRVRAASEAARAAEKAGTALAFDRAALFYRKALELEESRGAGEQGSRGASAFENDERRGSLKTAVKDEPGTPDSSFIPQPTSIQTPLN